MNNMSKDKIILKDKDNNIVEIFTNPLRIYETVNGITHKADSMLVHKDLDLALKWYHKWGFE